MACIDDLENLVDAQLDIQLAERDLPTLLSKKEDLAREIEDRARGTVTETCQEIDNLLQQISDNDMQAVRLKRRQSITRPMTAIGGLTIHLGGINTDLRPFQFLADARTRLEREISQTTGLIATQGLEVERRRAQISRDIDTAVNSVINQELEPIWQAYIPSQVNTILLTDLDDLPDFVDIEALAYVKPYVDREHFTVGISGERGSGKTTLMKSLRKLIAKERNALILWIHAPTTYNEKEFLTSLVERLIGTVIGTLNLPTGRLLDPQREGLEIPRAGLYVFAFLPVAIVALAALARPFVSIFVTEITVRERFLDLTSPDEISIIGVSAVALTTLMILAIRLFQGGGEQDELARKTEFLLRRLWFEIKESSTVDVSGEVSGLRIGTAVSKEYTRIPFSIPGLVTEWRNYVNSLMNESPRFIGDDGNYEVDSIQKVVVFLDELDKIDDPRNVGLVLRYVKVLFVEHTCFFASISEDARDRFRARTAGARDIFESSFDDVIDIERLSYTEIGQILAGRVSVKLPVPLLFVIYAVSKGNPRDAIRITRDMLENYDGKNQPFWDVARRLFFSHQVGALVDVYSTSISDALNESENDDRYKSDDEYIAHLKRRKKLSNVKVQLEQLRREFAEDYYDVSAFQAAIELRVKELDSSVTESRQDDLGLRVAIEAMSVVINAFATATEATYEQWYSTGGEAFRWLVRAIDLSHSEESAAASLVEDARKRLEELARKAKSDGESGSIEGISENTHEIISLSDDELSQILNKPRFMWTATEKVKAEYSQRV